MHAFMNRLPLLLAALWWGSLTTIGFLVVPLLFAHLPSPALAGATAAKLFTAQTWVSLLCGLLLLFLSRGQSERSSQRLTKTVVLFVIGGMLLALLAEFAVAPRIMARENLALWHGLGSGMYLLQWLCASVIFWKTSAQV
jgi:hypothetical protein